MRSETSGVKILAKIKKLARPLFDDIIREPGNYSVKTNPLVEPIHRAWRSVSDDPKADPNLKVALSSPENFVRAVAPETEKVSRGQMARGLRLRVRMYLTTEDVEESAIETVHKTGWLKGRRTPPVGESWQMIESSPRRDVFVKKEVLEEVKRSSLVEIDVTGFHATTSAALAGIERRKALVSSAELRSSGDQIFTGEVFGSQYAHKEVFVHLDRIGDTYGIPGWFGEYEVVFGISIEEQREHLKRQGKDFGLWSSSDGAQIGDKVPLENVTVISAPTSRLDEVKRWAAANCPKAKVISREAIRLRYGK